MDIARDKKTKEIVCAIELWHLDEVDEFAYECVSCEVTLEPASYKKDVNLKRPYFRLYRKTNHAEDCGFQKLKAKARKKPITSEGFPIVCPNKLVLVDERSPTAGTGLYLPGASHVGSEKEYHNHTTRTIRPLARTYLDYPFDRQHLLLEAPGVEGATYENVFQYLFSAEERLFLKPKIYYAQISYRQTMVSGDFADVTLSQGRWEKTSEGKNLLVKPYILRIHMANWAEKIKRCVLDEIEVARGEAKLKYRAGNKKVQAWLFFLGAQDTKNNFLFHVSDPRLVCCLADEMVRKSRYYVASPTQRIDQPVVANISPEPPKLETSKAELIENSVHHSQVSPPSTNPLDGSDIDSLLTRFLAEVQRQATTTAPASPTEMPVRAAREPIKVRAQDRRLSQTEVTGNKMKNITSEPKPIATGMRKIISWLRKFIRKDKPPRPR